MAKEIDILFFKGLSLFLISSLPGLLLYCLNLKFTAILSSLTVLLFTTCIFCFYFLTGIRLFQKPWSKVTLILVQICLLCQALQIEVLGLHFENYYGPYLGLGFRDTTEFSLIFKAKLITLWFYNGFTNDSNISIVINIFPVIALAVFLFFVKKSDFGKI
jgi:hypothetical protein